MYQLTSNEKAELIEIGIAEPECTGIVWNGPNAVITVRGKWNGVPVIGDWLDSDGAADIKWMAA